MILKRCYACHAVVPGETGRAAASAPDLDRSEALEGLPGRGYETWTRATLDAFSASPEAFAPGVTTTFVGMPDPKEGADPIVRLAPAGAGPGEE